MTRTQETYREKSLSVSDCQVAAWPVRAPWAVEGREKDRGRGGWKRGSERGQT